MLFFGLLVLVPLNSVQLRCCGTVYSDAYGNPFIGRHKKQYLKGKTDD